MKQIIKDIQHLSRAMIHEFLIDYVMYRTEKNLRSRDMYKAERRYLKSTKKEKETYLSLYRKMIGGFL